MFYAFFYMGVIKSFCFDPVSKNMQLCRKFYQTIFFNDNWLIWRIGPVSLTNSFIYIFGLAVFLFGWAKCVWPCHLHGYFHGNLTHMFLVDRLSHYLKAICQNLSFELRQVC